jgi:hypothetical protein
MKDVIYLLFDLLTAVKKLLRPGGRKTYQRESKQKSDANPSPNPFHDITGVESSGLSGVTGVSAPSNPNLEPPPSIYLSETLRIFPIIPQGETVLGRRHTI